MVVMGTSDNFDTSSKCCTRKSFGIFLGTPGAVAGTEMLLCCC
jgi:hypothetical protein